MQAGILREETSTPSSINDTFFNPRIWGYCRMVMGSEGVRLGKRRLGVEPQKLGEAEVLILGRRLTAFGQRNDIRRYAEQLHLDRAHVLSQFPMAGWEDLGPVYAWRIHHSSAPSRIGHQSGVYPLHEEGHIYGRIALADTYACLFRVNVNYPDLEHLLLTARDRMQNTSIRNLLVPTHTRLEQTDQTGRTLLEVMQDLTEKYEASGVGPYHWGNEWFRKMPKTFH